VLEGAEEAWASWVLKKAASLKKVEVQAKVELKRV
jgi:hypothetical protein